MFSTATIYTYNSVNLAVAASPSTLLHIIQEAGYRGDIPKNSVSCLNTYVCNYIPTLTMFYDQDPTATGYTCN